MAGKDIDVVIRAKDKASKEFNAIAKSIKNYNDEQSGIVKGAGKTSKALGDLGGDIGKLQKELDGLKSAGKIADQLSKVSDVATRMEQSVKGSVVELAKLARETEEAAKTANRLKGALEAEARAQADDKLALAAKREELKAVNKLVRDAETAQRQYNKALGATPDHFVRPAAKSGATFLAADLANAKASQAEVNAQIKNYEKAIEKSSAAVKDLKPQISAAFGLQKDLANQTERVAAALQTERAGLATVRTELGAIQAVSAQAGAALGTVALSQEQVSAAAQRMAANLAAAKARIEGLSKIQTTTSPTAVSGVDPNALITQRRAMLEARREWVESQAAVKTLGQQMKAATTPTEELGAAFGQAQAKARIAKIAYDEQRAALVKLGGAATSSFSEFSRGAAAVRAASSSTADANRRISASADGAGGAQRSLGSVLRQIASEMSGAAGKTDQFGNSLRSLNSNSRQALSITQRLRGEILSLTASYIGFQAAISQIGGAITAYRQLEAVQSRLGVVFEQDTNKVSVEIGFLRDQADRLGISFGVLSDEYGKFTVAADTANFTTKETREIFLSVAEAARVNRLSTEQTSGVFLALTQMISKGKVSSEELRRQLGDRLTGAFNIFASAIGVTTAELDKMMKAGEVIADRSTLLKFSDELTKRFGPQLSAALDSASTDIGRFENNIFGMQLTIGNGLIPGLRAALQSFDEFSKSTQGQEVFQNVGVTVGKLLQVLAEVPKYFDQITFAAQVFLAVKLADVFTNIAKRIVVTTAQTVAYNRELALIGPRTQAAAASQSVLNRGFAQAVSTLAVYRNSLLASTSQTSVARIGTVGLAAAVGGLRAVLLTTAAVARGFLAAFGGPIGILITGITLAIGAWALRTNSATTALAEHQRQLDLVVTGYQNAKDKAGEWATTVGGVTLAQAIQNTEKLGAEFDDVVSKMKGMSRLLAYDFSDFGPESKQITQLKRLEDTLQGVGDKSVSIKELETVLDDIARNPSDEQFKDIALELLNVVNSSDGTTASLTTLYDAMQKSEAVLRVMRKTATEADEALLGLPKTIDSITAAFDATTAAFSEKAAVVKVYTDAINELKSKIPGLAEELKKLKDITDLNKTAWQGLVAAFKAGDIQALANIIALWSQAGAARQAEADSKLMSNFPGAGKDITDRIIYIEGGQNGTGPSTSSARGIGQFTEGTWLRLFDRIFPELAQLNETQKLALRTNEEAARKMLDALTQENQAALVNAGLNPTPGNTYLAHFLGSGDAVKVLLANPEEFAKNVVQAGSVAANPTVIKDNTSVQDLINWADRKMGGGSPIQSGGMTSQEETDQNVELRVKALKEEAEGRKESNREGVIAKELADQQNAATKAGTVLTKEQEEAIRAAAGAKYDSLHADEALKAKQDEARDALNEIVGLDQQRKTLIEEINMAQAAGDNAKTAELQTQLTGINGQLTELIPKAMEFARALGDEKMVAQLQKVELSTGKIGQKMGAFGLSAQNLQQLVGSFADGFVGAFDAFAQAVANGENGIKALGTAFLKFAASFLREIATMILRQMFLNAIAGFSGPIGQAAAALGGAATGHTGGLVGSTAIGGGNASRTVADKYFANAMRYHGGGVIGLKPDEMPAVLKKNEEVLTEEDPRHRFNNAQGQPAAQPQPIKQVLVLNERDLADAMSTTHGEKVIITVLRKNAASIKAMLG